MQPKSRELYKSCDVQYHNKVYEDAILPSDQSYAFDLPCACALYSKALFYEKTTDDRNAAIT